MHCIYKFFNKNIHILTNIKHTCVLLSFIIVIAGIVSLFNEPCLADTGSHTGVDNVFIKKVTPRTSSDIPTPTIVPFSYEVGYKLTSAPKAKLRLCVFLWQPGAQGQKKGKFKGLKPLTQILEKTITKGSGSVVFNTMPISIAVPKTDNCQVVSIFNIQNMSKKELCWASTFNFLKGRTDLKVTSAAAKGDYFKVLSFVPQPKKLMTGHAHPFVVNLEYSLKTKDYAFLGLELIQQGKNAVGPWYSVCIPIKRGRGKVKVTTRKFFLPISYSGQNMIIQVPLRVQPLGGTVDVGKLGPWSLVRPVVK